RANHLACWPFGLRPDRFEDEPPGDEPEARSSRVRPCGEEDRTPRLLDEKRLLLSVPSAKRWRSSGSASVRKDLVEEPVLDRSILVADEDVRPKPLDGLQVEERKGRVVSGRKDDRVPFERSEEISPPVIGKVVLRAIIRRVVRGDRKEDEESWSDHAETAQARQPLEAPKPRVDRA